MNGKRTLLALIVIGLIALAAGTGCSETQVAAGAQPARAPSIGTETPTPPSGAQPSIGTPTPVVIVIVVMPTYCWITAHLRNGVDIPGQ